MSGSADAVLTVGSTAGPAPGGNVTWDYSAGMYDTTWVNNDHSHRHWAPPAPSPGDHQHVLEPQPRGRTAPSYVERFEELVRQRADEIRERTTGEVMRQLMGQVQPKAVPPPVAKRQDKVRRIRG